MSITIVGMGMASPGTLTAEALDAIKQAERSWSLVGTERLLAAVDSTSRAEKHAAIDPVDIARLIERTPGKAVCILMSGDTGFYSGTKKLLEQLGHSNADGPARPVKRPVFFRAPPSDPWQDWKLVSAHGKQADVGGCRPGEQRNVFSDGRRNERSKPLRAARFSRSRRADGERSAKISAPDNETPHRFDRGHTLSQAEHDGLAVMLVDNPSPGRSCLLWPPGRRVYPGHNAHDEERGTQRHPLEAPAPGHRYRLRHWRGHRLRIGRGRAFGP